MSLTPDPDHIRSSSAEDKIMAALPVIHNGLKGDLDPKTALEWVAKILTDDPANG